ncbi:hypothetical protein ACFYZJ_16820 [Streptomyces sp. NPDC001848]|uniref:phage terminase large subunit family protein n=1 Tax=Streptomyces sp. NPDC001848 TaxID=3364618 RepID=UPI0036D0ABBD
MLAGPSLRGGRRTWERGKLHPNPPPKLWSDPGTRLRRCGSSRRAKPEECMRRLAEAYHEHHVDCVVVETNNGGDCIPALLRTVDPNIPVRKVTASRGKHGRAQLASSPYEQHRVHHVGSFPELEEQLITWVPGSGESPDRLDALVWGLTDLKGLTGGSWADAYGQTACGMCGRSLVASLHPRNCPHCGAPRQ